MNWYDILTILQLLLLLPLLAIWYRTKSRPLLRAIGYYCILFSTTILHYANFWLHLDPSDYGFTKIGLTVVNLFAAWKLIQFVMDKKA